MSTHLFAEFPDTSAQEWLEKIRRDLRSTTPEALHWSPDGLIDIDPFVHAEQDAVPMPELPGYGSWQICETFQVSDARQTNALVLEALEGGTEAINFYCTDDVDWNILLDGVKLELVHLGCFVEGDTQKAVSSLFATVQDPDVLQLVVGGNAFDTRTGIRFMNHPVNNMSPISEGLAEILYQSLGAGEWVADAMTRQDLSLQIGTHYLVEIARVRALRILWNNLADAMGFEVTREFAIEAHTGECASGEDPYSHMIRSTFMGLAAMLGGADRICIHPARGGDRPESFYRHIARNIPHLVRYETRLTEISDPVAGAYYLDQLTLNIVRESWTALTQQMEKDGR